MLKKNTTKYLILLLSVMSIILLVGCVKQNLGKFQLSEDYLANSIEFDKKGTHYSLIDKNRIAELSLQYIKPYPGFEYKGMLISKIMEQGGRTQDTYRFRAWFRLYLDKKDEWDDYTFDIEYNPQNDQYSVMDDSIFITRESLPSEIKNEAFELAKTEPEVNSFISDTNRRYDQVSYRWYYNEDELTEIKDTWPDITGEKWIVITVGHTNDPDPWPYFVAVNINQQNVLTGGMFGRR